MASSRDLANHCARVARVSNVGTVRYREWCQRSWLGVVLFHFLTARAASNVVGDIKLEGWPPPGGLDTVHGAFNGTVVGHNVAVSFM